MTHVPPLVSDAASIRDALENLKQTGLGLVCVATAEGKVVGVCSDGDLRNVILNGAKLDDLVIGAMNANFTAVQQGAPRERVLKMLDTRIKVAPILDAQGRFVDMASRHYIGPNGSTYARAKAPVRLSLAGGGTDITRHFIKNESVSLSVTMARYSHVSLCRRADEKIRITSHDLNQTVEADSLAALHYDGTLDLLKAGARLMKPDYGFELVTACDFPPASGLGGSASLLAAVVACFNEFRADKLGPYEIAEHAFEAERIELGIVGGWQDQYSTVFGGLNFLRLNVDRNLVMPLRVAKPTLCELEERLLICYTGQPHLGNEVQKKLHESTGEKEYLEFSRAVCEIAQRMSDDLLRGHLSDFGTLLSKTWELKRRFTPNATSPQLDDIYDFAKANGAQGGRLLGTGGGGFFLFAADPFRWHELAAALRGRGLKVDNVLLDFDGLRSWTFTA